MFQPKVLHPDPDPFFVRELRKVDPNLRVVWGYDRYLNNAWAIERKIEPERYFLMYESILSSDEPRFIKQPIFDENQPEFDENGDFISYKQVGIRDFDLAPEYEFVAFTEALDSRTLTLIREGYWEQNHPEEAARIAEKEKQDRAEAFRKRRIDAGFEGIDEAFLETRKKVQFGYGETRNET